MTAVLPARATSQPKASPASVSAPVNFATCGHVAPERTYSNTAPELTSWPGRAVPMALASTVPPEIATDQPKKSPVPPPLGVSVKIACCDHLVPDRWNTYAAPACPKGSPGNVPRFGAPITAVSPSRATENPKVSLAVPAGSLAASLACWVHPAGPLTNTYAAPVPAPGPTIAVVPETAIAVPNRFCALASRGSSLARIADAVDAAPDLPSASRTADRRPSGAWARRNRAPGDMASYRWPASEVIARPVLDEWWPAAAAWACVAPASSRAPVAASPITARDHDLPTLRGAPAVLLSYTMFLRVVGAWFPPLRQCCLSTVGPGMGRFPQPTPESMDSRKPGRPYRSVPMTRALTTGRCPTPSAFGCRPAGGEALLDRRGCSRLQPRPGPRAAPSASPSRSNRPINGRSAFNTASTADHKSTQIIGVLLVFAHLGEYPLLPCLTIYLGDVLPIDCTVRH